MSDLSIPLTVADIFGKSIGTCCIGKQFHVFVEYSNGLWTSTITPERPPSCSCDFLDKPKRTHEAGELHKLWNSVDAYLHVNKEETPNE